MSVEVEAFYSGAEVHAGPKDGAGQRDFVHLLARRVHHHHLVARVVRHFGDYVVVKARRRMVVVVVRPVQVVEIPSDARAKKGGGL